MGKKTINIIKTKTAHTSPFQTLYPRFWESKKTQMAMPRVMRGNKKIIGNPKNSFQRSAVSLERQSRVRRCKKISFWVVTPVKTGVQAVLKGSKILDSGFRRNDGKKTQADFFTPSDG
jgi:hypothetical protein